MTLSPGGKNPGLCTLLQKEGGGKRRPFCRRKTVKAFHAHTHNMQESQDNEADSVGLMNQVTGLPLFVVSYAMMELQRKGGRRMKRVSSWHIGIAAEAFAAAQFARFGIGHILFNILIIILSMILAVNQTISSCIYFRERKKRNYSRLE